MRYKLSNVLWGLFFIVIGIGYAGNVIWGWDFSLIFPGWWTFLIIIPCLISMIRSKFGVGSTIGFIIGVLLLAHYYVNLDFSIWQLIIPAILILIGVRIMFQNSFHRRPNAGGQNIPGDGVHGENFTGSANSEYSAIFSSNRINVTDTFTGTNLSAVFGSIVLDLRNAVIPCDVKIDAQAIFGGIDIYIPAGVKIKVNNIPVFGGVSNKTGNYNNDPAAPTIYLNSTCMFGGIDIK